MLQANAAAVIEEGLEVLIVVVHVVLDREDRFDEIAVLCAGQSLERREIDEVADAVGDRALGQRRAFEGRDDADHVDDLAVLEETRLDAHDFELHRLEFERLRLERALALQRRVFVIDGQAVDGIARDHQEAHGMDRHDGSRRQHGTLHALLAAAMHERLDIVEIAELGFVGA